MTESQKRSFDWIRSVLAISLALLLPLGTYLVLGTRIDHNAKSAFIQSCEDNNQTRQQFLAFVDSTISRSENSLNATMHSPSASVEQKAAAVENLAALKVVSADAHKKETQKSCVYPPLKE